MLSGKKPNLGTFDFTGSDKVSLPRSPAFGYRSAHGRLPTKTYLTVCRFLDDSRNSF